MYLETYLQYINDLYKSKEGKTIEFEIKLILNEKNIKSKFIKNKFNKISVYSNELCILNNLISIIQPVNSQTVNFISQDVKYESIIKTLCFTDGVQNKDMKKFTKKKILHPSLYIENNCFSKFSLSSEEILPSKDYNSINKIFNYSIIRFKNRFIFKIIAGWEIHFTFICSSNVKDLQQIKIIKNKIFQNNLLQQYLEGNSDNFDFIEIEIEYTDKNKITQDELKKIYSFIDKICFNYDDNVDNIDNIDYLEFLTKTLNIKKKIFHKTLKKILPNVIEINKKQYFEKILPNIDQFYLTDKADGIRSIVIIKKSKIIFLNSSNQNIIINEYCKIQDDYILECEMVNDKYYAFDIIMFNGENLTNESFHYRLKKLQECNDIIPHLKIKKFIKLNHDNYSIEIKDFYNYINSDNYKLDNYNNDGLIFTSNNDSYLKTNYYKWKPITHMSIDFLAKKCPKNLLGIEPYNRIEGYELYLLFVGISMRNFRKMNLKKIKNYKKIFLNNQKDYFPIRFMPSNNLNAYLFWSDCKEDLNGKIIELTIEKNMKWKLLRIREDRNIDLTNKNYYGNDFKVAEIIWMNYHNPLTINNLCSSLKILSKDFYFLKRTDNSYDKIRNFNNFCKYEIFNILKNDLNKDSQIIDLASGHGQDMFKYINQNIHKLLFIDNNENNLCEIINRKYSFIENKKYKTKLNILIKCLNLNDPYKSNIKKMNNSGIYLNKKYCDLVVCNFAIHYFTQNRKTINNLISFVNYLLPVGGRFLFICLDGKKVFNLLKDNDVWGDDKYNIRKLYSQTKFTGINQKIELLLPFSNGKYYEEYLVNLQLLKRTFKKYKLIPESSNNLTIFMDKYLNNKKIYFTDIENQYLDLLCFNIYIKY